MRISELTIAAVCAAGAASAEDRTATAYLVSPAHNAAVTFAQGWGPALTSLWTASLDGPASFPLVAKHAVYALVSGNPTEIVKIDAATGKVIWKLSAGSSGSAGLAYDDGKLFSVNQGGALSAYSAGPGKLLWTVQLPGQYFFTAPPSALNGIVYVGGSGSGGTLYAVQESSGKLIWSQPVANGDTSSPAVTDTGVYVSYPCQYYDFAPTTGKQIWFAGGGCDGGGGSTPVVYNNQVFIRDPSGEESNSILNASTGALLGTFAATAAPVVHGKTGYFLDYETLSAVDPKTSKLLWEFTGDGSLTGQPIVANDYVIALSSSHLYVIDSASGAVASTTNISGYEGAAIGAGGNTLFVPLANTLVAYGSTN
jgi:outer membrane protein assembly factor BamB